MPYVFEIENFESMAFCKSHNCVLNRWCALSHIKLHTNFYFCPFYLRNFIRPIESFIHYLHQVLARLLLGDAVGWLRTKPFFITRLIASVRRDPRPYRGCLHVSCMGVVVAGGLVGKNTSWLGRWSPTLSKLSWVSVHLLPGQA